MKPLIFYAGICLAGLAACQSSRKAASTSNDVIIVETSVIKPVVISNNDTYAKQLQLKYAGYININPEQIENIPLYQFIDYWLHTPYKWGGTDKRGIDCSAFIQRLLDSVYQVRIPRTSVQQFYAQWINKFKSMKHLSEGDLIFFRTVGNNVVSHVGMYLDNGYFVNSSSSKGVSIASIKDPYWKSKIVGAGRVNLALIPK